MLEQPVLEGLHPENVPTLEQLMKNCSLWEWLTLENFVENCLPWDGFMVEQGKNSLWTAAETTCDERTTTLCLYINPWAFCYIFCPLSSCEEEWQSVFAAYLASRQGQTQLTYASPLLWGRAPHPLNILNTDLPYLFQTSRDRDALEFLQVFSCHIKSFLVPDSQCYGACWVFLFNLLSFGKQTHHCSR